MTAAREFFRDLFVTLTGRMTMGCMSPGSGSHIDGPPYFLGPDGIHPVGTPYCILHGYAAGKHLDCVINTGPYCGEPVTQGQIEEGDAHPIDERGPDDGKWEHDWCVQGNER